MSKLIIKIMLLVILVFVTVLFLFIGLPKEENCYYAAMDSKTKRLSQLPSPKIILVGGSNLTFGVDSKRLEEELNMPIVNMSLHAGLGFEFILNQILDSNYIKSGDVIILSPEYECFKKNYNGDAETIFGLLLYDMKYIHHYTLSTIVYHLNSLGPEMYAKFKRACRKHKRFGLYSKLNVNEYGDMIGHLKLPHQSFSHGEKNKSIKCDINDAHIELLEGFVHSMTRKNVKTYIVFPAISETGYNNDKACNDMIADKIMANHSSIILSDNDRYIFADGLFFNTKYHLDNTGREIRTNYLISDLRNSMFYR